MFDEMDLCVKWLEDEERRVGVNWWNRDWF